MRRSRRNPQMDKYGRIFRGYRSVSRIMPYGEYTAVIGNVVEKKSHGNEVLRQVR